MIEENYSQDFDRPSEIYTHDDVTPVYDQSTFKSPAESPDVSPDKALEAMRLE